MSGGASIERQRLPYSSTIKGVGWGAAELAAAAAFAMPAAADLLLGF